MTLTGFARVQSQWPRCEAFSHQIAGILRNRMHILVLDTGFLQNQL
jgi:hypothetical protein